MQTATLNAYQKHVVDLMNHVDETQQMEISHLLANYFAQKAIDEADRLWGSGVVGEQTIEKWKHEHMREALEEREAFFTTSKHNAAIMFEKHL